MTDLNVFIYINGNLEFCSLMVHLSVTMGDSWWKQEVGRRTITHQ